MIGIKIKNVKALVIYTRSNVSIWLGSCAFTRISTLQYRPHTRPQVEVNNMAGEPYLAGGDVACLQGGCYKKVAEIHVSLLAEIIIPEVAVPADCQGRAAILTHAAPVALGKHHIYKVIVRRCSYRRG